MREVLGRDTLARCDADGLDSLPDTLYHAGIELKHIQGYPGYYAGADGNIYSMRLCGHGSRLRRVRTSPKKLRGRPDKNGYLQVYLSSAPGEPQTDAKVATLILTTFVGPKPDGCVCCHDNGINNDNRPSNLRWDTPTGNARDKVRHGTNNWGERHGHSKLTNDAVVAIRQKDACGVDRGLIAEEFGIARQTVSKIATRRAWKHIP